jgi:DNA (cytosine-5)-methyltransferase 1
VTPQRRRSTVIDQVASRRVCRRRDTGVTHRGISGDVTVRAVTPNVTGPVTAPAAASQLVLSLFPGIGLLDMAFRGAGMIVVSGPDLITGGRIEDFHGIAGRFDGIIAGPPCQDFSCARRAAPPSGNGIHCLGELLRVIVECMPTWFLVENVPGIPDLIVAGYAVQRLDVTDAEFGGRQLRRRHIQFGHRAGWIIRPERLQLSHGRRVGPAAMASDGSRVTRSFAEHCRLQGLDRPVTLPGWSRAARFAAVGNGVALAVGRALAAAVLAAGPRDAAGGDCVCGCGRRVTPPAIQATAACRKRMERRRKGLRSVVTPPAIQATAACRKRMERRRKGLRSVVTADTAQSREDRD